MTYQIENKRLKELVLVAESNRRFYDYFVAFLKKKNLSSLHEFIQADETTGYNCILDFLKHEIPANVVLYDGVMDPYTATKAKWFFLAWILRDAPAQRLQPMIASCNGDTVTDRKADILNRIRIFCKEIITEKEAWSWACIREVMVDRLEGSRRAKKGTLFEAVVREILKKITREHNIKVQVSDKEIRLEQETYDVSVVGEAKTLLIPVKTRETMGGGHANIFTRDIRESIAKAARNNYAVFPIIVAESWGGNIADLETEDAVVIDLNPNQLEELKPILREKLTEKINILKTLN